VATGAAVAQVANIIITSNTTGQGTVVPAQASLLGPGVHTGTITVTACTSSPACTSGLIGSPQTVAVTYTVTGVASSSSGPAYSLGLNSVAADYPRSIPVVAHPSFTATSNANWVTVTPGSGGSGSTQLAVNLVQSAVDAFESGDHVAVLTLTVPGGNTLQLPVLLTVTKPQVDQVTPYVAEANRSGTVTLRGSYLDQLSAGSLDFAPSASATGVAPTTVTLISPTEMRVVHPALPAGTHLVRIRDAQGAVLDRSTARLVVMGPTNYPRGTVAYPPDARYHNVQALVYDAERKALLLTVFYGSASFDENDLMRFEYTTSWSSGTVLSYPSLDTLALSADGRDLIAASNPVIGSDERARIALLSPTTLVERVFLQTDSNRSYFTDLAVLSNNDVLALEDSRTTTGPGRPLYRYSTKRNTIAAMTYPPGDFFSGFARGSMAVSGDGQRVVAASDAGSTADQRIYEYSASSNTNVMVRSPPRFDVQALRLDRNGDTLLMRGDDFFGGISDFLRIYDRDWNVRGSLPLTAVEYVLAPDGSRAYTYDDTDGEVHIYDLTAQPVLGVFPEIASLALAGSPDEVVTNNVRMAITPDGRTLFLAGGTQIVVQPLP